MDDSSCAEQHGTKDGMGRRRFLTASGAFGIGLGVAQPGPAASAYAAPAGRTPPASAAGPDAMKETAGVPDIVSWDALELSGAVRRREVSCVEVMEAYLDHIGKINPHVDAVVGMQDPEISLRQARERDRQLSRGERLGWMHGFPHVVKDLAEAEGLPWTEGSPLYADRVATRDALHVKRIKDAGAVVVGKTNTPEFGLGSQSYNQVWGTTGNAYDPARTAGGSSGGAAAALALRMTPVADGSDYMGSLRNPAAFNNVLGMRPSWGGVPSPGFVAQLAVTGPMARKTADLAGLMSVMAGPDSSAPLGGTEDPGRFRGSLDRDFRGTRIAWVGDWGGHLATESGVLDVCRSSFAAFEDLGCEVVAAVPDFSLEELWETFLTWRWWSNLDLHDLYADPAKRKRLKPEAVWEVEHGIPLTALDIQKADASRNRYYAALTEFFESYDFVLAPSAQVFPFDKRTHWPQEIGGREMDTYHRWMETVAPWSLSGLPVIGMPAGFDGRGLPMGIQLIGRNHADLEVLQLAHAYEKATGWVDRVRPDLLG